MSGSSMQFEIFLVHNGIFASKAEARSNKTGKKNELVSKSYQTPQSQKCLLSAWNISWHDLSQ